MLEVDGDTETEENCDDDDDDDDDEEEKADDEKFLSRAPVFPPSVFPSFLSSSDFSIEAHEE